MINLYQNDIPDNLDFVDSVAVDTETMGLVPRRDRLCLVQLCSRKGDVHLVQMQRDTTCESKNLKRLLQNSEVLKIFHFARFDLAVLNYTFNILVNPVYCTKIGSKLSRTYSDKHSLRHLCRELLDVELSKQEQTSDWGRQVLSDEQVEYASRDVLYLHSIREKLDEMLRREHRENLALECFRTVQLLAELDLLGLTGEELFQHH
ncbi:MAG: ribonuclease H-like domain-containing protein [Holosporaceae bacterium]|jgi:ribonuclease D|nr:ribonuclease H-like domain-containing protein [Holosporaceae bacterium]